MNTSEAKGDSRGVCPVCHGTTRMPCPDFRRDFAQRYGSFGYDKDTDSVECDNCGGQYQFGKPSGTVKLDKNGDPCKHSYASTKGYWNCTTNYRCIHCGDSYMIDSGG